MLKGNNYCITKENIAMHEMIGLNVKVFESTDEGRKNMKGKIVDETKNTFTIETAKGEKKVPKSEAVFEFELGNENVMIDGKSIIYRPEDRVKAANRGVTDGRGSF